MTKWVLCNDESIKNEDLNVNKGFKKIIIELSIANYNMCNKDKKKQHDWKMDSN